MTEPWLDSVTSLIEWNEENRVHLHHFLDEVANTCLKIKILELFLYEPYLCLPSTLLADRIGETCEDVRDSVRELYARLLPLLRIVWLRRYVLPFLQQPLSRCPARFDAAPLRPA